MKTQNFIISICTFCFLLLGNGIAQPSKEQIAAFRSARTVRIVVNQSSEQKDINQLWCNIGGKNLPFYDYAKRLFHYSGKKICIDDSSYDLLLTINARLTSFGQRYHKFGYIDYSGARIKGSVVLQVEDVKPYKEPFEGEFSHPLLHYTKGNEPKYEPSDAPFNWALSVSNFKEILIKIFTNVYGIDWLITATKDEDWDFHYLKHSSNKSWAYAFEKDEEWGIHQYVLAELIKYQDQRLFDIFTNFLKYKKLKYKFRGQVLVALARLKDNRAYQLIVSNFNNYQNFVRSYTAEALGILGDIRAVEPLISRISDKDINVRVQTTKALGMLGDVRAVDPLLSAIPNETSDMVKYSMINAMGALKDNRSTKLLINILVQSKLYSYDLSRAAAEALGSISDTSAVIPLISILMNKNLSSECRKNAAHALGKIGDPRATRPLMAVMLEDIVNISFQYDPIAKAIVAIGDTTVITPMISVLKNSNQTRKLQFKAIDIIGEYGDAAIKPLISIVSNKDFDNKLRDKTLTKLCRLGDSRTVPVLIDILHDKSEDRKLRVSIASTLGKFGDDRAVPVLISIIHDKDEDKKLQYEIIFILGKYFTNKDIIEQFIKLLKDKTISIRRAAIIQLERISGKHGCPTDYKYWKNWWENNKDKF